MKIDLSAIDREQFLVHEHIIAGETCYLVQPQFIGTKWTKDNLHLRSSLWNSLGELISASFPKFFNWNEQPDLVSHPSGLNDDVQLIEKLDGSTLIVSKYKGHLIVRTRGTVDATKLDNGHEIEIFKLKYPKAFMFVNAFGFASNNDTASYSYLYEWTSPLNKIVIDYGKEPDIRLIGCIDHDNYQLATQRELDLIADACGVKRPRSYSFNTIEEMIAAIEILQDKEGICVYFNQGQSIRKLKALAYLTKHRFKEQASLPNVLDLWFAQGRPNRQTFEENLTHSFDFECFTMVKDYCVQIADAATILRAELAELSLDIEPMKNWARRDAALKIQADYTAKGLAAAAFLLLSNREIDDKVYRKLIERRLGL